MHACVAVTGTVCKSNFITQLYYFHKNSVPQNGEEVYTYTFMGYGLYQSLRATGLDN